MRIILFFLLGTLYWSFVHAQDVSIGAAEKVELYTTLLLESEKQFAFLAVGHVGASAYVNFIRSGAGISAQFHKFDEMSEDERNHIKSTCRALRLPSGYNDNTREYGCKVKGTPEVIGDLSRDLVVRVFQLDEGSELLFFLSESEI